MRFPTSQASRFLARVFFGSLANAALTAICYRLHLNLAATSLLFLFLVVIQSLGGGLASALTLSLVAALLLDYFFVPPVLTWVIADPLDLVALLTFVATAVLISRLASRAREQARTAERQRQSLAELYEASQRLLWLEAESDVAEKLLRIFREVFGLRAVCLFDGRVAKAYMEGESPRLAEKTREAYFADHDRDYPVVGVSLRCLRTGGKVTGAIGFENLRDVRLAAGPLTALAMIALERARAAQAASRAAAVAQTEVFRAAVLDALAHEFKTPLAAIVTAAGSLQEVGPLNPVQHEMAEMIEVEGSRLGDLASRLLRTAELDKEQVQPRLDLVDVGSLAVRMVEQYAGRFSDRRIWMIHGSEPAETLADEQLLWLALTQLLDNAVKYSRSGSEIRVTLHSGQKGIRIHVWNNGSTVPLAERERIFERFYRGTEARHAAPGSGLGLYVARKIVSAHGGTLDVDPEGTTESSAAFCLTLPISKRGLIHGQSSHQSLGRG